MTRVVTNELFFKFDDGRVNFDGEGSEALIAFVKAEQLPLVNEFCDKICTPTIEIVEVIKQGYVSL